MPDRVKALDQAMSVFGKDYASDMWAVFENHNCL